MTQQPQGPGVRVVRSRKRRKTVSAQMVEGVLEVAIPAWMSKAEERRWVDEMRLRFARKAAAATVELSERASMLCARYRLPVPASVRWVDNQQTRWGSCTPQDRTIRISSRLASVPLWVLDYVLVHELAHLVHADHGAEFWTVVARYPKVARAQGFLEGLTWTAHRDGPESAGGTNRTGENGPDGEDDADDENDIEDAGVPVPDAGVLTATPAPIAPAEPRPADQEHPAAGRARGAADQQRLW